MEGPRKRRRLLKLWEADPRCHWCQQPTIIIFRPQRVDGGVIKRLPVLPNEATTDHLNDRYGERPVVTDGTETTVLSCYECNHRRGQEATAARPIEELWKRSGSYPSGA